MTTNADHPMPRNRAELNRLLALAEAHGAQRVLNIVRGHRHRDNFREWERVAADAARIIQAEADELIADAALGIPRAPRSPRPEYTRAMYDQDRRAREHRDGGDRFPWGEPR